MARALFRYLSPSGVATTLWSSIQAFSTSKVIFRFFCPKPLFYALLPSLRCVFRILCDMVFFTRFFSLYCVDLRWILFLGFGFLVFLHYDSQREFRAGKKSRFVISVVLYLLVLCNLMLNIHVSVVLSTQWNMLRRVIQAEASSHNPTCLCLNSELVLGNSCVKPNIAEIVRKMSDSGVEYRCFIGGLSWSTSDRVLKNAFEKFGHLTEAKVVVDRVSGRSRGFGFVTFEDEEAMEEAIRAMNGMDLDGRAITVDKAQPQGPGRDRDGGRDRDRDRGRDRDYGGGRGSNGGECFKCGKPGHFARECPSGGGGRGDDRYGGRDDRYGGGGGNSRYGPDRNGDRYSGRNRDGNGRGGSGGDRYSRDRSGPYERPSGGESSSLDTMGSYQVIDKKKCGYKIGLYDHFGCMLGPALQLLIAHCKCRGLFGKLAGSAAVGLLFQFFLLLVLSFYGEDCSLSHLMSVAACHKMKVAVRSSASQFHVGVLLIDLLARFCLKVRETILNYGFCMACLRVLLDSFVGVLLLIISDAVLATPFDLFSQSQP
ncbi:hypothetical protein ACLOJK_017481 [Asimina triloba]